MFFIILQRVKPEEEWQQQLGCQSEHWGRLATPLKTRLVQLYWNVSVDIKDMLAAPLKTRLVS